MHHVDDPAYMMPEERATEAASIQGAVLFGTDTGRQEERKRVKLSDLQRGRR